MSVKQENLKVGPLSPELAAKANLTAAQGHEARGFNSRAIQGYNLARKLNPKLKGIAHHLAVLYARQGFFGKAWEEYQFALNEDPTNSNLHTDIGQFYSDRNNPTKAEYYHRKAIDLDPTNKRAWTNLGVVLSERKLYPEGFQAFVNGSSEAEAHNNLAWILARHGHTKQAIDHAKIALHNFPGMPEAEALLATLEERLFDGPQETYPATLPPRNIRQAHNVDR